MASLGSSTLLVLRVEVTVACPQPLRRLRQGSGSSRPLSETLSPKVKSKRAELQLVAPHLSSVGQGIGPQELHKKKVMGKVNVRHLPVPLFHSCFGGVGCFIGGPSVNLFRLLRATVPPFSAALNRTLRT